MAARGTGVATAVLVAEAQDMAKFMSENDIVISLKPDEVQGVGAPRDIAADVLVGEGGHHVKVVDVHAQVVLERLPYLINATVARATRSGKIVSSDVQE